MGGATAQEVTRTVRFQQCSCIAPFPHGYFEDMSGERIVKNPAMSKEEARQVLARLSGGGSMPPEEVALVEAEIEATPLAENGDSLPTDPTPGRYGDLGDLLEVIFGGESAPAPSAPPYGGPYSFRVIQERDSELPLGQFLMPDGSPVNLKGLRTKVDARKVLDSGITSGSVKEEERDGLLAAIENSELPEEETPEAIAERSRFSFRVFEEDGVKMGWFLKGRKRIRSAGPQRSKRSAIALVVGDGPDYDRLVAEIRASDLPR